MVTKKRDFRLQDNETQGFGVITIKLEGSNGNGKSKGDDKIISLKDDDDDENDI